MKTGGGHYAPARALAQHFQDNNSASVATVLVDGLANAPTFSRSVLEGGYRILQSKARWYYEMLYALNKFTPIAHASALLASLTISGSLKSILQRERPDRIVILHFLLIRPVVAALKSLNMKIDPIVVVTDPFTAHPLWFLNKKLDFIVSSEILRRRCVEAGIGAEKLHVFPTITGEKFSKVMESEDIDAFRRTLGIAPERKVVLLLGGGDGLPRGERILQGIVDANLSVEIIIVCGKNRRLEGQAKAIAAASSTRVTVFGYTTNVYELINISDVVISKGGASTIMEILLCGKMPIVTDYLWEQEKGNVEFLTDNGVGVYETNVNKVPNLVRRYLADEQWRESVTQKIMNLGIRNGTQAIGEFILEHT